MTERQGTFTVPTRLYLTDEQRRKLERLIREEQIDLADLVTDLVAGYLDTREAPPPEPPPDRSADLQARRAELARLRTRRATAGSAAPAWLDAYIADLEAEIARLSARQSDAGGTVR